MRGVVLFSSLLISLLLLFFSFSSISASEGRFRLEGKVSCEGVSVWDNSRYSVFGRCNGLGYPYTDQLDEYVLWADPGEGTEIKRIDSIERGIIDGSTNNRFRRIFITAESSSSPQSPNSIEVASGTIESFNFQEPTLAEETIIPVPQTPTPRPGIGLNLGAGIPIASLILFILVIAVLAIIVFRSR